MLLFKNSRRNLDLFEAYGKPSLGKTEDGKWLFEVQEGGVMKAYFGKGLAWEWSTSKGGDMIRSSAKVAELNALVSMLAE